MFLKEMCADCGTCFNLKILFDVRDMELSTRQRCLESCIRTAIKRDRIVRLRCAAKMIRDNDGLPKDYKSSAALRGCVDRTSVRCGAFDGDPDD